MDHFLLEFLCPGSKNCLSMFSQASKSRHSAAAEVQLKPETIFASSSYSLLSEQSGVYNKVIIQMIKQWRH